MARKPTVQQKVAGWRDPAVYAYTSNHSSDIWAWEFLRRNDAYRLDWSQRLQAYTQYCRKLGRPIQEVAGVSEIYEPDGVELEAERRWGLIYYYNPAIAVPADLLFSGVDRRSSEPSEGLVGRLYSGPRDGGTIKLFLPQNKVAAVFDYSLPVKPQLREVERRLRLQQSSRERRKLLTVSRSRKRVRSGDRNHWVLYVRALDGRRSGATLAEIGEVLLGCRNNYPGRRATDLAKRYLRAAQDIVEGGYRGLPGVGS